MTDRPAAPEASSTEEKKSSKTWLIILIVVLVLCCLCAAGVGVVVYLYQNGDRIFKLSTELAPLVALL